MFAASTATSRLPDLALDAAKNNARTDLGKQLSVKISSMFKRYREESGAGEDAKLRALTTTASKAAVSQLLKGAKTAKQSISKDGNLYNAYVLMKMSNGEVGSTILSSIKGNKELYTQFRASKGFKELEAEVAKGSS